MQAITTDYRDTRSLSQALRLCLWIFSGWGGASLLVALLSVRVYGGTPLSLSDQSSFEILVALVALGFLLTYLVTAILFAVWIHRSKKNAAALADGPLEFGPGWSIGWFFVPILSLWKPYESMEESFQASDPLYREDWPSSPTPGFLPWWWGLWLVSNIVGRISGRLADSESASGLLAGAWADVIASGVNVPLGIVAAMLVGEMYRRQEAKQRLRLGLSSASTPAIGAVEDYRL